MKVFNALLFVVLSCTSITAHAEGGLTKPAVKAMLDSMNQSAKKQQADRLMSHFAPDATITLDMPSEMGGRMQYSVEQYKKILKQAWSSKAEFSYETRDQVINIASDGKRAIATDVTIETMSVDGKVLAASMSKEKIEIIDVNGVPVITSFYGKLIAN